MAVEILNSAQSGLKVDVVSLCVLCNVQKNPNLHRIPVSLSKYSKPDILLQE